MGKHITYLEKEYPSGAQKWACRICGRTVIWQWHPRVKSIELVKGNDTVTHGWISGEINFQVKVSDKQKLENDLRKELESIKGL